MQVQVTGLSTPVNTAIRERVEEQVASSLQRLRHHIRGVRIKVDSEGYLETTPQKRCLTEISLYPAGLIVVEGKGSDVYAAINDSLVNGKRCLNRHYDRLREPRREAAQHAFL